MMTTTYQTPNQSNIAGQAARLLELYAGYLGTWTIDLGLRAGLIQSLADRTMGATSTDLAVDLDLDADYVDVWCQAAFAAGLLDLTPDRRYVLAPHLATLLLDTESPEYLGGLARACVALRQTFVDVRRFVRSGGRKTRSRLSTEWVAAASDMSRPIYQRLADQVIPGLPTVAQSLHDGGRVLELTCGTCSGPAILAHAFPNASFTAVDSDWYSIEQARLTVREQQLSARFGLIHSDLASLDLCPEHDLAIVNLALHGAVGAAQAIEVARDTVRPGGTLLINTLPSSDTVDLHPSIPARIVAGMQYADAHLGRRTVPVNRIVALLEQAGFRDIGVIEVTSLQTVVTGMR